MRARPRGGGTSPQQVVLTCEHASNAVPRGVSLGLPPTTLREHVAWDIGAADAARALARALARPVRMGEVSRLVVDLNRALRHPRLVAAVSCGVSVPGNAALDDDERAARIDTWWRPYREGAEADVSAVLARWHRCLHVSIHSFTPDLRGKKRRADVGLLYDPAHPHEAELARLLQPRLRAEGLVVRRNFPYRGTSDGLTTSLRRELPGSRYAGMEVEINQERSGDPKEARRLGRLFGKHLLEVLPTWPSRGPR